MFSSDDPKAKWFHLVVKLIAAVIIFHLGVLVGEFKMVKRMVLGGGGDHKMLFWGKDDGEPGAGARFFHKKVMPGAGDMMWKQEALPPGAMPQPGMMPPPTP